MIRLISLGLIVASLVVGGAWFWVGLGMAALVVAGVAGGTRRGAAGWLGSLALLMGALVHTDLMNPFIGSALAGLGGMGFLLVWTQGPARRRPPAVPLAPYILRRRAG